MAPTPSVEGHAVDLLETAAESITHGLDHGRSLAVEADRHPGPIAAPGASFVTLRCDDKLRGCIGTLEPHRPLIVDVAENAWAAAFRDPRFPPLERDELDLLRIAVSVLGVPEPLTFEDEEELLAQIEPGRHGMILSEGGLRSTFLPAVWESLPEPRRFLGQLKRKAGLPEGYWSDTLEVWRYTVQSFEK